MYNVLASRTFMLNAETEEIIPSSEMSNEYTPEEMWEVPIETFETEKGIFTTFEVDNYNMEGIELNLPLYCEDKASYVENYMEGNVLVNGWLEDAILDLCVEQSEEVLLSRAMEVVSDYPEEIIKSMNGTEYFNSMELHKALMESDTNYQECLEHYMIDYSIFEVEETASASPYIKDNNNFYKDLETKCIHLVHYNGKYAYNMYKVDLQDILFENLNYQEVLNDINFHRETVCVGNINIGLVNLEAMLHDFLHNLNPKHFTLNPKEERVLKELNCILDDLQWMEMEEE